MTFRNFFSLALLPSLIASQTVTIQNTLTLVKTVTETQIVTVSLPTEPLIPPAVWSTAYVPDLATDVVFSTTSITSTLSGTTTRTLKSTSTAESPHSCSTSEAGSVVCGVSPEYPSSSSPGCDYTTSRYIVTYTETYCQVRHGTTSTKSASAPTYSCDPLVNWSCISDLLTYPTPTPHRSTSTAFPIGTTDSTPAACEETSSARSTQSNSPHAQTTSSRSNSTITSRSTASSSGSYHPTSSSSSSPVTAGSTTVRPRFGSQLLAGLMASVLFVMAGHA